MSKQRKIAPILRTHKKKTLKEEPIPTIPIQENITNSTFQELLEAAKTSNLKKESNQRKIKQEGIELPTPKFEASFCPKKDRNDADIPYWSLASTSSNAILQSKILEENGFKQEDMDLEDKELFDYESYYPTILPMKPVNQQTFDIDDDSHTINPQHLGNYFIEKKQKDDYKYEDNNILNFHDKLSNQQVLFQMPSFLPKSSVDGNPLNTAHMPSGLCGKLIIYKSGKIKLKLGEALLDVNLGMQCPFEQEIVAINTECEKGHCAFLGTVHKSAVCTYDVEQLLEKNIEKDNLKDVKNDIISDDLNMDYVVNE